MSAGFDTPGLATAGRLYLFVFVLSVKSVVKLFLLFLAKLLKSGSGA
jgi:hypothetical protein